MKQYKITQNDSNQRLDKFLKKLFPNANNSLIYKLNRKEKIKIKSSDSEDKFKKRDNEYRLQIWDEVKIFLSEEEYSTLTEKKQMQDIWKHTNEKLDKKDIVYEDNDILVINKNPGINVHPWDHKTKESNIIYQVQDYLWDKLNSLTFKPSLIHRIDRDTSWLLLIWKQKDILTKLVSDFKNHEKIKKTYYAIVIWKLSRRKWTIKKNLLRIEDAKDENKVRVDENWQTAVTHYHTIKEHILQTKEWVIILTELEIQIETWRMHQIRVHMANLWNPVLWDKAYWDKKINWFFAKNYWFKRHALHAWKINFFHYGRDKKMELMANIKDDLVLFLESLKNIN